MEISATVATGILTLLGVCLLAMVKGGPAERWAAIWVFATWLTVVVGSLTLQRDATYLLVLSADGVLAIALLFISIQFSSVWLGAAMLTQSSAFTLHAWFLTAEPANRDFYVMAINLLSYTVLTLVLGATLARLIRRAVRARSRRPRPGFAPVPA